MSRNRRIAVAFFAVMAAFAFANLYVSTNTFLLLLIPQILAGGAGIYFLLRDEEHAGKTALRVLFWLLILAGVFPAGSVAYALFTGSWLILPAALTGLALLGGGAYFLHRLATKQGRDS